MLIDDDKRRIYDQVGEEGLKQGGGGGGNGGGGPGQQQYHQQQQQHFHQGGGAAGGFQFHNSDPFANFFSNMFGGGGGGGQGGFGGFDPHQHQQGGGGGGGGGGGNVFSLRRDGIYPLTGKDFPSKDSKFVWLVLFYDPQSISDEVVQEYVKLGEKLKSAGVKTGAVDCGKHPKKCEEVVSSESVVLFRAALITKGEKNILDDSTVMNNRNSLNLKKMYDFVKDSTPNFVLNIRQAHQLESLLSSSSAASPAGCGASGACLILWTAHFDSSLLMKTLAVANKNIITVAEVRGGNEQLAKVFHVEKFPTIMMACATTGQWQSVEHLAYEVYEGDYKNNKEINAFVNSFSDKTKCKSLRSNLRRKNMKLKKSAEEYMQDIIEAGEKGIKEFSAKKVSELKKLATNIGINVEKIESLVEKKDLVQSIFEFWGEKSRSL